MVLLRRDLFCLSSCAVDDSLMAYVVGWGGANSNLFRLGTSRQAGGVYGPHGKHGETVWAMDLAPKD